jgi:hypothetical protein
MLLNLPAALAAVVVLGRVLGWALAHILPGPSLLGGIWA